jgi:aspartate carbamoyltransferase
MLMGYGGAIIFYQQSTRTYTSFVRASQKLGADVVGIHEMNAMSSAVKGENLPDTIRSLEQTTAADFFVLRHPDDDSSDVASAYTDKPIINAGSGRLEHPTQAVLDIYTIQQELGRIDDLTITMTGDLRNGRTIKSLADLLAVDSTGVTINFVAPEILAMPQENVDRLRDSGVKVNVGSNGDLRDAMRASDVLYVTRLQKEWFNKMAREEIAAKLGGLIDGEDDPAIDELAKRMGESLYHHAAETYVINEDILDHGESSLIVMHPLPRVGEIAPEVDDYPNAAYFRQMRYGLESRTALIAEIMGK